MYLLCRYTYDHYTFEDSICCSISISKLMDYHTKKIDDYPLILGVEREKAHQDQVCHYYIRDIEEVF